MKRWNFFLCFCVISRHVCSLAMRLLFC